MGRHRRGRSLRDASVPEESEKEYINTPKSFIVSRGKVAKTVQQLVQDLRQVFRPYTAVKLRERRSNVVKDYIALAGPLAVSHLVVLSEGGVSRRPLLRLGRMPQGPTLVCSVSRYSLAADVRRGLAARGKNANIDSKIFDSPPVVVLNGFVAEGAEEERRVDGGSSAAAEGAQDADSEGTPCSPASVLKVASALFGALFPPITLDTNLPERCQRIILLSRNKKTGVVEFRHYALQRRNADVPTAVRRLLHAATRLGESGDRSLIDALRAEEPFVKREERTDEDVKVAVEPPGGVRGDAREAGEPSAAPAAPAPPAAAPVTRRVALSVYELGPRMSFKIRRFQGGCFNEE